MMYLPMDSLMQAAYMETASEVGHDETFVIMMEIMISPLVRLANIADVLALRVALFPDFPLFGELYK